tara:strand:+ start:2308 stop:2640 length:333 start_codon:yes stop_codon:yes gene_type:complete
MSNKKYKSITIALRSKGKSCEEFENMLSSLSIEEVLALKLELSSKMTNGKLFGFPILKGLQHIIREAALLFAHSAGKTNNEAASILGITNWQYRQLMKKYKIREFFKKSD